MIEIYCLSSSVAYFYFFYTLMGSLNLVVVNLADLADLLTALMFWLPKGNKRFDDRIKILLSILIY